MSKFLSFFAGDRARSVIQKYGLTPDRVKVIVGAAGGPKWLILGHMDRFLFSEWFKGRTDPLLLAGSSAGAWRFAAVTRNDPAQGIEKLAQAYIHQHYTSHPTFEEIDGECRKIIDRFMGESALQEFFNHPYCRPIFFSVRAKGPAKSDHPLMLLPTFASAALFNAVHRSTLKLFFERTLFHHPAASSPFFHAKDFPPCRVPLTPANFKAALLSSGSIPLVMPGVTSIPGAPHGVYRDGGVIDYHLDLPFLDRGKPEDRQRIILFLHYTDRIVPGWLDKHLPWRGPCRENLRNVLLVTPSRRFIDRLPGSAIPERRDFTKFKGRNGARIHQWKLAWREAKRLEDELGRIFSSQALSGLIRPL